MPKGNGRKRAVDDSHGKGALALGRLLDEHEDVLEGLVGLRELGPAVADAVAAVMASRDLRRLRLSWELFDAVVADEGLDPEVVLKQHLPAQLLDLGHRALWGKGIGDGDRP